MKPGDRYAQIDTCIGHARSVGNRVVAHRNAARRSGQRMRSRGYRGPGGACHRFGKRLEVVKPHRRARSPTLLDGRAAGRPLQFQKSDCVTGR
jgi:hypothetical protein